MKSENEEVATGPEFAKAIATYNEQRSSVFEKRKGDRKQINFAGVVAVLAVAALSILAALLIGSTAFIWVIALGVVGTAILWFYLHERAGLAGEALQNSMAGWLLPQIVDVQDFQHSPDGNEFPTGIPKTIRPSYDRAEASDLVKGRHLGCRFEIVEVELIDQRSEDPDITVFEGLAIRLELKAPSSRL